MGQSIVRSGRGIRCAALASAACLVLSACAPQFRNHGYIPRESELAALELGRDTRDSVAAAIGRPATGGVLTDDSWYYVQSRFRHFGPFAPEEVERQVLAIRFDEAGRLRNIERFGLQDGRVVALSRRVTDDNIGDRTFLRQLLRNITNFDAGRFIGGE
jgi:outer membrane protein assembly factor BamE (lipoprotein component of BamABCDE complex)